MKNYFNIILLTAALNITASATPLIWNINLPNGNLGTQASWTATDGATNFILAARGYATSTTDVTSGTATLANLYGKNLGFDETGLGFTSLDPSGQNEIVAKSFVQLDLTNFIANNKVSNLQLEISSIQSGEGFRLYGSNTVGQAGTLLQTGGIAMDNIYFSAPAYGTYKYYSISASSGNILLGGQVLATSTSGVPEPSSMVLSSLPLVGLIGFAYRRRKQQAV